MVAKAQLGDAKRQRRERLTGRLGELRAHGVQAASFYPNGRLKMVSFGVMPEPDDHPPADEAQQQRVNGTRQALQVLQGTRKEMFGKQS